MRLGGRKHKHHMGRRFFKCFEQSIKGSRTEHVHFINNVYLRGTVGRHIFDIFTQLPDLIHTIVGGAVDFKYVDGIAGSDLIARSTDIAWFRGWSFLAIHGLGQYAGDRCFAGSPRPGKQDRVGDPPRGNGIG